LKKKSTTPINNKIYAKEVMLIGSDGEKLGLLAIEAALEEAQKKKP
jgi:translation initiation factor IF-3